MACRGGAQLLDRADDLGAVQPSWRADLVVVDLTSPFVAPVHRVPSALVYCATPRDVIHVLVDGRFIIRDRKLTTGNEEAAVAAATAAARKVLGRAGMPTRLLND
jgi:5-methylthioadenosine/S-adenosylhomocysteine deaminase